MTSMSDNEKTVSFCTSKNRNRKVIVFGGPTASGKSGLALRLAERINGVVINADSMQVYKDVPTLTARPLDGETKKVDHKLYGFLDANQKCSAASWASLAAEEIENVLKSERVPILAGGTGMYIQTLEEGISPLPEVGEDVRASVRERFERQGYEKFLSDFIKRDPQVRLTDPQRLIRAAEIFEATGKSIVYWQSLPLKKAVEASYLNILVLPPREVLYARCNERFSKMLSDGAMEEVRVLLSKNPPSDSLIMKAIGVKELSGVLKGELSMAEAEDHAKQMTRNYAKRQTTWFKHRFKSDLTVVDGDFDAILTKVLQFLS